MNKLIGIALSISGLFFVVCAAFSIARSSGQLIMDVDVTLFLLGGIGLLGCGALLWGDVSISPPGSLMVRRGDDRKHPS